MKTHALNAHSSGKNRQPSDADPAAYPCDTPVASKSPARHTFLAGSALAFALAISGGAQAQEAAFLEEIIVTAQKREQALQDVALPVTAIAGARLQDTQVLDMSDLQYIAPTLTFGQNGGFVKIFMRGIGLSEQTAGIDPSVALHVDGAVVNSPIAHFTSVFDLDRVELLRGPQGTLYGRNATGGAINLVTAKPTREFEGYARGVFGNYNRLMAEAAVSGPLADKVLARIAFRVNSHSGFGRNETTDNDVDDADRKSIRGHLKFNFSEDVDLLVTAEWYREDDHNRGLKFKRATFPVFATLDPVTDAARRMALQPIGLGGFAEDDPRNTASEFDYVNEVKTWATTATLNWRLNDSVTITNILNYREARGYIVEDFDMSSVINRPDVTGFPPSIHIQENTAEQVSEELQLNYSADNLFNTGLRAEGIFGFFYFTEDIFEDNRTGLVPARVPPSEAALETQRVILFGDGKNESWAFFGNATLHLNEEFAVKLGGRFTSEDRSIDNTGTIVVANGLGPTIQLALADDKSFDDFTPEVGVQWRPNDNMLLYYTYSEGFKTGAGLLGNLEQGISDPEKIQNHEVGLKSTLFNRRLIVNVAGFMYDLKDLQVGRTIPDPVRGFIQRFENAAQLDGKGIEVEFQWQPVDQFRLNGAMAYLDAEFKEFASIDLLNPNFLLLGLELPPLAGFPPGDQLVSLAGNRPRQSPELAFNIHAEYDFPTLPNGALITVAGDLSYKDEQYFSEFNDPVFRQGSYTIVDARLTYASSDGRWQASVWGKNLADKQIEAGVFAISLARTAGRTFLPPRTYGITVDVNF